MITEVSAVNFRQNLGEMLRRVQYRNDSIIINKDGRPVAALVDTALFSRIRRMQERFDTLSRKLGEDYANVPEAEGLAEIDAAAAVRSGLHTSDPVAGDAGHQLSWCRVWCIRAACPDAL